MSLSLNILDHTEFRWIPKLLETHQQVNNWSDQRWLKYFEVWLLPGGSSNYYSIWHYLTLLPSKEGAYLRRGFPLSAWGRFAPFYGSEWQIHRSAGHHFGWRGVGVSHTQGRAGRDWGDLMPSGCEMHQEADRIEAEKSEDMMRGHLFLMNVQLANVGSRVLESRVLIPDSRCIVYLLHLEDHRFRDGNGIK